MSLKNGNEDRGERAEAEACLSWANAVRKRGEEHRALMRQLGRDTMEHNSGWGLQDCLETEVLYLRKALKAARPDLETE